MTPCYYNVNKVHRVNHYVDFGFGECQAYRLDCDATAYYVNGHNVDIKNATFGMCLIDVSPKKISKIPIKYSPLVITNNRCDSPFMEKIPGLAYINPPKRYYEPVGAYGE